MNETVKLLAGQVQRNCDIADARHARDYTMCIYLMKMREYFRWEKGFGFTDRLPAEELGQWLTARETHWQALEDEPFAPMEIDGRRFDPFDNAPINEALAPLNLVYSGGYGGGGRPHFFLARLQSQERCDGYSIFLSERELARELTAPPAMSQPGVIFVRRESVRRMLWEKMEEWQWRRRDNPMGRAAMYYDFDSDFTRALEQMTDAESDMVLLHERGEIAAGLRLGPGWERMLATVAHSRAEHVARAVRDHLADSLSTLPHLLARRAAASLHFYIANLSGMRLELYPALRQAYDHWRHSGDWERLERVVEGGRRHWESAGQALGELFAESGQEVGESIEREMGSLYC